MDTPIQSESTVPTLTRCEMHPSLIRPILLGGADRTLVMLNLTVVVTLIFGVGLHLLTILLALTLGGLCHLILLRLAKYDPEFSRVYGRHLRYRDCYLAQSSIHAPSPKTHRTWRL